MIKKHKNNFEVCEGCFDTHIHGSPDIVQRKMNDIELAIQAKKAK